MLVVCNGAIKSGSTWLYEIARVLVEPEPLPREYADSAWLPVESVPPHRLADFAATADLSVHRYVVKEHISRPWRIRKLLRRSDVLVIDIQRDLRDVVVSSYHHFRSLGQAPDDFTRFYWSQGRYQAAGVFNHHRRWSGRTDLTLGYESLVADFTTEARKLATLLGHDFDTDELRAVADRVGLSKLRERYAESGISGMPSRDFFRSGAPGGWSSYLDSAMLDDLERISRRGLPMRSRVAWFARSRVRRQWRRLRIAK